MPGNAPDPAERALIEDLVRDLAGTDAARCGEAHARLAAMGGFSRPEIREALERALLATAAAPAPRALPAPRRIGSFELGACLGRGGFGIVHHARDLDGNAPQPLCVKLAYAGLGGGAHVTRLAQVGVVTARGVGPERILADAPADGAPGLDDAFAARVLEAEAAFLRDVGGDCDLFPEVYAAGHADGVSYLAMERLEGRDLRAQLLAGLDSLDVKRLFRRLARELAALHGRRPGFFHGDLKPENVVVVAPTRLRLVDPAFRGDADAPARRTLSAPYNPLALTGEAADTAAIAITLLELLTGVHPLLGLPRPLGADARVPLDAWAPHASRDPLVARLLSFVARPPTYAELADALR